MKIGDQYDTAIRMGVEDSTGNQYGNKGTTTTQNYHNLVTSKSHMMKNSEWGAAAYLSASSYGAGVNKVQINGKYGYITGCGPQADGNEDIYESDCKQYNTDLGQLASTTGNTYGIYDMSGGAYERVMGGYSSYGNASITNDYISNAVKPPYADIYPSSIFTNDYYLTNNNQCTWVTCGGHALFETSWWGSDYSYFESWNNPWFLRGGIYSVGPNAGVFASGYCLGYASSGHGFRVVLL